MKISLLRMKMFFFAQSFYCGTDKITFEIEFHLRGYIYCYTSKNSDTDLAGCGYCYW